MFKRRTQTKNGSPVRLLLWTGIAVILLTWLGAIQPIEDVLRVVRNRTHVHAARGDIVLVPIDDHALRAVGRWPWPRRYHAQLIDELTAAGAIYFHVDVATAAVGIHAVANLWFTVAPAHLASPVTR